MWQNCIILWRNCNNSSENASSNGEIAPRSLIFVYFQKKRFKCKDEYKDQGCDKTFTTKAARKLHYKQFHLHPDQGGLAGFFPCEYGCTYERGERKGQVKMFHTKTNQKEHYKTCKNNPEQAHFLKKCPYCNKYYTPKYISKHKIKVHKWSKTKKDSD